MEPGKQPIEDKQDEALEPAEEVVAVPEDQGEDPVEVAAADAEAEAIDEALSEALARCKGLEEEVLRVRAEMDNLRKRSYREVESARKFALERFMGDLVEVTDSLERGLQIGEDATADQLREGSELTLRQLTAVLNKHGLALVDPESEPFNPEHHEAISMVAMEGVESGTVIQVVQKGYLLNDRLLRPARVVVAE